MSSSYKTSRTDEWDQGIPVKLDSGHGGEVGRPLVVDDVLQPHAEPQLDLGGGLVDRCTALIDVEQLWRTERE